MRPVNLIPPEDRRGERTPTRTGPLAYVVLGGLAVALAAVVGVVLTQNSISDRQSELTSLQAQQQALQTRLARVQSYSDLAALEQNRVATVTSLAESRFDWWRVLRELALVIPNDVWLTSLNGTVSPDSTVSGGSSDSSSALRDQITGPALEMSGCADGHDVVARFLDVLRDIDGATRVAVTSSDRAAAEGTGASSTASGGCDSRGFIARFDVIVAFDGVSAPEVATTPAAPTTAPTSGDGGVAGAQAQEQQARDSIHQQTQKARDNVSAVVPGTVGG
jgi:Tfp pilus assembly protein PilN